MPHGSSRNTEAMCNIRQRGHVVCRFLVWIGQDSTQIDARVCQTRVAAFHRLLTVFVVLRGRMCCLSIKNNDKNILLSGLASEVNEGRWFQFHKLKTSCPPVVLTCFQQKRKQKKGAKERKRFIVISNADGAATGKLNKTTKPKVVIRYTKRMGHIDQVDRSVLARRYPFKLVSWKVKVLHWIASIFLHNIEVCIDQLFGPAAASLDVVGLWMNEIRDRYPKNKHGKR